MSETITIHKKELTRDEMHKLHLLYDAAPPDITPSEQSTLLWLSSCDMSIVNDIVSILQRAKIPDQDPIADASETESSILPPDTWISNNVYSVSDAAALWGLDTSTIRRAIKDGRLMQKRDCHKIGNQWIITKEAMYRLYGTLKEKDPA